MSINAASMRTSIQRVMHSIGSKTTEIAGRILQPTITRIAELPESYPKTMQALEPTICALFRFSHNHPKLSLFLVTTAIAIITIAQGLLLS